MNNLFEDATIEDAKKAMQNMFNDITPEQFEELKKQALENVKKNNMSAKEMFEKLGYKQLEVEKPFNDFLNMHYEMELPYVKKVIYFLSVNEIKIYLEDKKGNVYPPIIELAELQAINKQIEELSWNKD